MPYVIVKMMEGRTDQDKCHLMKELTKTVESSLKVDRSQIRIEIEELKEDHFSVGGDIAEKVHKPN